MSRASCRRHAPRRVRRVVMSKSRPRAGAIRSHNKKGKEGQILRPAMLPRSVVAVVPLASHCACSGWASLAFMSASVITSATFRRDGSPLHFVLAPSRPRYASPPQFKAHYLATLAPRFEPAPLPALHCPSLHRLRTLRSTSRVSALQTSSRGHGLGLRSVACFARRTLTKHRSSTSRRTVAHHRALSKGLKTARRCSARSPETGATQKNKAALSPAAWHPPIPCPCRLVAIASAFAGAARCFQTLLGERARRLKPRASSAASSLYSFVKTSRLSVKSIEDTSADQEQFRHSRNSPTG